VEEAEKNVLSSFFEEVSSINSPFHEKYKQLSGICLSHLSDGLGYFAEKYSQAADFLI
jgi:hypothetical protein